MSKEAMKLALEALKNSVDSVSNEAREAESLYGKYPSRLARVQGLVALEVAHQTAIKALEEALANHCEDNLNMVKQERPDGGIGGCATCGAAYADQIIKQEQQIVSLQCAHCQVTIETLNDKVMSLLAKQEQGEPVAADDFFQMIADRNPSPFSTQQRTWVGLTHEDKASCVQATAKRGSTYELIAAIEAKLKDKNK
jgi:hypothetical protein